AFVKTNGGDGGNDGLYKFDGSAWAIETDVTLTGTVAALPGGASDGQYYLLTSAKDGHPAGSIWKREGGAWVFVTKTTVAQKVELPKDEIATGTWFQLTEQDGSKAPGFYKRSNAHEWELQGSATVGSGDRLPTSPAADQLFRLFEHEVTTTARAGASKATSVGVAGALAINILDNTTEAIVSSGAVVTLTSAASSVSAESNERDVAKATSRAEVGSATGVGAAFSLQVIDGSVVRAEIQNSAAVSGGTGLTVDAWGFRDLATASEGGTTGGTAVTPVVALVVSVDDDVTARIGTGAAGTFTGAVLVSAGRVLWIASEGKADAAGSSAAVGAVVVVNAVVGADTLAELARSIQGTSVQVLAPTEVRSEAKAVASASGASESGKSGDSESKDQVTGAGNQNPNTQGTSGATGSMPTSNGGTNGSNGATGANGQSSSQSGTGSGTTAVAAAVGVNWVVLTSTARIAANAVVTATSGAVTVRSTLGAKANAFAMGSALDIKSGGDRITAAIGLNVQDLDNIAAIGTDAVVTGQTGITVEATVPMGGGVPQRNEFGV
ncbi:MAG: hypothetical protein ACRCSL_09310, partial [Microbacterium sp.]